MFRDGDTAGAAAHFERVVSIEPANEVAHSGLIRSHLKRHDTKKALEAAEAAQQLLPDSASVSTAAGDVLLRLGRFEEAEAAYRKAAGANPAFARAYLGLARAYGSDFRFNSARGAATRAFELDPTDPEIILEYAAHVSEQDKIAAYQRYLQTPTKEPKDAVDWVERQLVIARKVGRRGSCALQGEPRRVVIPLSHTFSHLGYETGFQTKMAVNGREVKTYLDSGVSGLVISRQMAERLKLEVAGLIAVSGVGDGGVRLGQIGLAHSVQVGGVEFRDCLVKIVDRSLIGRDALAGTDLFAPFLVTLDFPRHRIRLNPLPALEGCRCDDPRRWTELDRRPVPQLKKFSPWRRLGALPLVRTILNGRRTGWFILDTGAEATVVNVEFARDAAYLTSSATTIAGVSGKIGRAFMARGVALDFAGIHHKFPQVHAADLTVMQNRLGVAFSGLIGNHTMSQMIVTISYRDGLIDVRKPGKEEPISGE